MPKPKIILLVILLLATFTWLFSSDLWRRNKARILGHTYTERSRTTTLEPAMKAKAAEAKSFARKKGFNENICFLINMALPSGQNRFFVYDLDADTLQRSGLVTHGRCNEYWLNGRKYGNSIGCGCTSLGRYRIGNDYYGRFGLAFKLYGLDKTNDKAFDRFVVLHSHACVPEREVADDICQSDGCPTISPGFLASISPIIRQSRKPILLWIYE